MRRILTILILFLIFGGVTAAQEDENGECDYAALAEELAAVSELLVEDEDPRTVVADLQRQLAQFTSACSGLSFSSDEAGLQPVIGPVTIEAGLYRATVTTPSFFNLEITAIEGSCGPQSFGNHLFLIFQGQAADGAQVLFESDGCEALLSVSNTLEAWTLEFEKLN